MLAHPTAQQTAESVPHPRRIPAHLSVSLRHDNVPTSPQPGETGQADSTIAVKASPSPNRQDSEESGRPGRSNVENWFDQSNNRPASGYDPQFEDSKSRTGMLTV